MDPYGGHDLPVPLRGWLDSEGTGLPGDSGIVPDRIVRTLSDLLPAPGAGETSRRG